MSANSSKSQRYTELDAVRGVAALAVVLFHYTSRYRVLFPGDSVFPLPFTLGFWGVELFFGISGFVILMTLHRCATARDFIVSRFSRLYPAYWAAMISTFVVLAVFGLPGRTVSWGDALVNLTMWQEFLGFRHVDSVYWSLQVELIFYCWMLGVFMFKSLGRIHWIVLGWVLLGLIVQFYSVLSGAPVRYFWVRLLLVDNAAFFAIGVVSYMAFSRRRIDLPVWTVYGTSVLAAWAYHGVAGLILAAGLVALFFGFIRGRADFLRQRPLLFLGQISYPLYLLHQNIGYMLMYHLEQAGLTLNAAILLALGSCIALAYGLHRAVEQPALRIIRGWFSVHPPVLRHSTS